MSTPDRAMPPAALSMPDAAGSSPLRRVAQSVGANTYSLIVTVCGQLLLLPLFLMWVGPREYAHWIIYSTIFAYLAVADFGVYLAAGNELTMALAAGRRHEAGRVYDTICKTSCLAVPGAALVCIGAAALTPDLRARGDAWILALLFALAGTLANVSGHVDACYRATGAAARGTLLMCHARAAELLGVVVGLAWGRTLLAATLGQLIGRALPQAWMLVGAHRRLLAHGVPKVAASARDWRDIAIKSIGGLQFQFSGMAVISLSNFFVLSTFGAASVAALHAHRVLSRTLLQVGGVLGKSLAPEVARLYGSGSLGALGLLVRRSSRWFVVVLLAAAAVLIVSAPALFELFSRGQLGFDPRLFALLLLVSGLSACAFLCLSVLQAVNRVLLLGAVSLLCTALLGLALFTNLVPASAGLLSLGTALAAYELALLLAIVVALRRFLLQASPASAA